MEAADLLALLDQQQFRRLRVIENLLREKKTVSTLYWGLRYRLLYLIALDKKMARGALDAPAQSLIKRGWAETGETPDQVRLTAAGATEQAAHTEHPQTWADWGMLDLLAARKRLLLAVQVVSQYAHSAKRYYPLATDLETRRAVRNWFHQSKNSQFPEQLFDALKSSLEKLPPVTAGVVTDLFTGYGQPGLTADQLALSQERTAWTVALMQFDGVMQIAQDARNPEHPLGPLFRSLWQSPVTRSAQQTLAAVSQGRSVEQIASVRRIKPGTAREHLLEAAILLPLAQFPYDWLLTPAMRTAFATQLTGPIDAWQYTALPQELQDRYTFFDFRLYAIWCDKRGVGDA